MNLSILPKLDAPQQPEVFTPKYSPISGPAYGLSYRLFLAVCLTFLTGWAASLSFGSETQTFDRGTLAWLLAGLTLVLYMGVVMLRSRTTLTTDTLSQDWIWEKKVALAEVTYVRLVRLRGLDWLIAPRLLVRAGSGPFKAFHTASPEIWSEFERWSKILSDIPRK